MVKKRKMLRKKYRGTVVTIWEPNGSFGIQEDGLQSVIIKPCETRQPSETVKEVNGDAGK